MHSGHHHHACCTARDQVTLLPPKKKPSRDTRQRIVPPKLTAVHANADSNTRLNGVATPLTAQQYARRLRALALLVDQDRAQDRVGLLDRYDSRQLGRIIKVHGGDTRYTSLAIVRCGQLDIWLGLDVVTQTWTARIEGYPEVAGITTTHQRVNHSSTVERAAKHALAVLTQHAGRPAGSHYDDDLQTFVVRALVRE